MLPKHEPSNFPHPNEIHPDCVTGGLIVSGYSHTGDYKVLGACIMMAHEKNGEWVNKSVVSESYQYFIRLPSREFVAAVEFEREPLEKLDDFDGRVRRMREDLIHRNFGPDAREDYGIAPIRQTRAASGEFPGLGQTDELSEVLTWEEITEKGWKTYELKHTPIENMEYENLDTYRDMYLQDKF